MTAFHGRPCWYELGTSDLDAAQAFYARVMGWQVAGAGMEGFDYRLASAPGGGMVAGMFTPEGPQDGPCRWLIYVSVDDCDATARQAAEAGGAVLKPPADIPGTGRFAVLSDPQGAHFGILQPDMRGMSPEAIAHAEAGHGAFDQDIPGHGAWNELMTTDPQAALGFYARLFGWAETNVMDIGPMGTYRTFGEAARNFGGIMGLGGAPVPGWLAYFGVTDTAAAIDRIRAAGGTVQHGPMAVPGGSVIAIATDPQGAWFAVSSGG